MGKKNIWKRRSWNRYDFSDELTKEEGATCQKLALENPEIEAHDNMSHELYEAITQERLKRAAIIKEVA